MNNYTTDKIRNIGFFGHSGSGKSSLAEAILFSTGAINRMGKTENENIVMDFSPEEKQKKISINTSLASVEWNKHKINILDTPGYDEYIGEVFKAMHVIDSAVITVSGDSGVEVGTDKAWEKLDEIQKPRLLFVNRLDKENVDFDKVVQGITSELSLKAMPLQFPIGTGDKFEGIIDLSKKKAYYFKDDEGKTIEEKDIPEDQMDTYNKYKEQMMEAITETDDELMMKYLEGEELSDEEITKGLKQGISQGIIFPILCGIATKNYGTKLLMDEFISHFPSPADVAPRKGVEEGTERKHDVSEPFSGIAFKMQNEGQLGDLVFTKIISGKISSGMDIFNSSNDNKEKIGSFYSMRGIERIELKEAVAGDIVVLVKLKATTQNETICDSGSKILFPPIEFPKPLLSLAALPKSKADSDKLSTALSRLSVEDPTFTVSVSKEFAQTIISGMGETHLEMTAEKMKKKFGVECILEKPKLSFRETITKNAKARGRHKKQSGGKGQFGDCHIEVNPNPGKGFEYIDKIVGGKVPRQYIPAVEKGIVETMAMGIVAGYPIIDLTATIYDGSYHDVDSSEMAFKIAGSLALKNCFAEAAPIILEPIINVEVKVPDSYMGDVMGDMNSRRGRIMGMEPKGRYQIIKAQVPESEMFKYVTTLKSMTQGRGSFSFEHSHYEQVPAQLEQQLKDEYQKEKEEANK